MQNITEKLNILISCGSYSWGGLEMISLETANKIRERGINISILCSKDSRLEEEATNRGFETVPVFGKNKNIPSSIIELKNYLKDSNIDVIHSNHSHDLWVITPALKLSGSKAKLFLTKHMASGVKKTDLFHKYLYKRVNKVFAISNYIKTSVKNTTPVKDDDIILLPVGIDMKRFDRNKYNPAEIKRSLGLPEDKIIIGIAGRMTPGKGHEEFLEAAKMLNDEFPGKLFFLVIGNASFGEEKYEESIIKLSETLGLQNIKFTGYTAEPEKLMTALDVHSFPSHDESFGRVLLEAMALGIPTAASGYAGVLDITIENETGLLFEPKNAKSQAESLSKLIADEELRKKFSLNGKNRAEAVFTFDIMTDNLIKLYKM